VATSLIPVVEPGGRELLQLWRFVMTPLSSLFEQPAALGDVEAFSAWFARVAAQLLGPCQLQVQGAAHRLVEVEFYFHGVGHLDPFVHGHPLQQTRGRWYFHRAGASYRGGSFKGVDLTFGDGVAHSGILIRSLETPEGQLVVGPSLCVDHLLARTECSSVAELDRAIGDRPAWDPASPLQLTEGADPNVTLFRTARVGLSLKRHQDELAIDRLARRYRFLSEPRRVTKGRAELIAALLADGHSPEDIRRITGSPLKAIVARR
jgi:hypothetical protein